MDVRPIDGIQPERVLADITVLVTYREPMCELWEELVDTVPEVYLVGDALSPRDLVSAMREGHFSARSIDYKQTLPMWHNM
ncbi:hypothetical protein D3C86_1674250 [compost metagenome]